MQCLITLFFILVGLLPRYAEAQDGIKTQTYPKALQLKSQQFSVRASNSSAPYSLTAVVGDTVDLGNDGYPGAYAIVSTGQDSVRINYTNLPYGQRIYIPLITPAGKATYRLRFNGVPGQFTDEYVRQHTDKEEFEIPEVYELANILWVLSAHGEKNTTLPKSGPYYEQVVAHFKPFINHPVFALINQIAGNYSNYYDFRENSYAYHFEGNKLIWTGPHYYVMGNDNVTFNSLFRQLALKIEDFAKQSGYRAFYKSHQPYYQQLMNQQKKLMPVRTMWTWLEARFPQRFSCYRVVFSPLIGGSHSTQQYGRFLDGKWYKEAIMFVNGPSDYLNQAGLTDQQRQGVASGIVFTEIDHNYVNPTTSRFRSRVDSIFSKRAVWTKSGGDTESYGTPQSVFNEYMTHALFCLYVSDQYDPQTAAYVIDRREKLMVDRRNYIRFREFTQKLTELYAVRKPDQPIAALYPALLDWAKSIQ
ncbi:DUF4932 domain-containing protein [Fibrella forsythiae]|uniref:DUF4932 domain-containing protein n=1 Tax=Fibrella forsythiae TaxID=2817061 RepID=A0ABS3JJI2_9BACT|nr:DUF4932 domain-containing protein [Fibrella forsythiae]MBO0949603.1 DUF4932 domain-containing protein [Fibrella forsythiae]